MIHTAPVKVTKPTREICRGEREKRSPASRDHGHPHFASKRYPSQLRLYPRAPCSKKYPIIPTEPYGQPRHGSPIPLTEKTSPLGNVFPSQVGMQYRGTVMAATLSNYCIPSLLAH